MTPNLSLASSFPSSLHPELNVEAYHDTAVNQSLGQQGGLGQTFHITELGASELLTVAESIKDNL